MKNFFGLLFAAVALFAFVGCETAGEDGTKRLATPVVSCNVQDNTIIVTWEAVNFAVYYEVALNDGEAVQVEDTVYRYAELDYNTEYTVKVKAISADKTLYEDSEVATKTATTPERLLPQYREWYAAAPVTAVSNNGRWAVGAFDKTAIVIDLNNDNLTTIEFAEFSDVSDNGIAVGARFQGADDGGTAVLYKDGEFIDVNLGDIVGNLYCSSLTGITPDGEFAVGWYYDYAQTYYTDTFGMVVPFAYDIAKDRVIVLQADATYQQYRAASQTTAVAPDHRIVGFEQSQLGMLGVTWADAYANWEYIYMETNEDHRPTVAFGSEGTTLLSPSGRYVFGQGSTYADDGSNTECAAAYDFEAKKILWFPTMGEGSVTAMTDDGIAFLNDVPYGYGTTSFIANVNEDLQTVTPIVDYLKEKHNMDLSEKIIDGIIIIGTSEDGRTWVGMTSTNEGYCSFVIELDGVAE